MEGLLELRVIAWDDFILEFPSEVLPASKVDKVLPKDSRVTAATFYIIITNNYMNPLFRVNSPSIL